MTPRFHARFPGALCEGLAALGRDARLAAYRIEPVRTVDGPQHYLDLTFADGERIAVVAGIRIDRHALAHRDRSPFVAPREAAAVAEQLEAACDAIEPALIAAFTACAEPGETLHVFADVAEEVIVRRAATRARSAPCRTHASPVRAGGPSTTARTSRRASAATSRSRLRRTCPRSALRLRRCAATSRCPTPRSLAGGAAYHAALAVGSALGCDDVGVDVAGTTADRSSRTRSCTSSGSTTRTRPPSCSPPARAQGIRTLLTPLFDDAPNGGYWGARDARAHARARRRRRSAGAVSRRASSRARTHSRAAAPHATPYEPRPGFRAAQRAALAGADVVFVASASEGKRIRALGVERVFAAYVPAPHDVPAPDPGVAPYVLAVAPVGPLHASATLARAAARAGLPVRFTGAVVDGAYAARARSYLDDRSSFAPGDPGRGARVVADVSWTGTDLSALAAHAVHGVPIVGSNRAAVREVFGSSGVWEVDPGRRGRDRGGVVRGLEQRRQPCGGARAPRGGALPRRRAAGVPRERVRSVRSTVA